MKQGTASGLDGLGIKELIKTDKQGNLSNIFNIFLVTREMPDKIKANRSILLP
jgi:hypothetical protein